MSNNHSKPKALLPIDGRRICPVCGETSYSVQGIHPQCAVAQADAKRMTAIKQKKRELGDASGVEQGNGRRWQKQCPECGCDVHVRKKTCDCGRKLL